MSQSIRHGMEAKVEVQRVGRIVRESCNTQWKCTLTISILQIGKHG